jgi:hypothetical protein
MHNDHKGEVRLFRHVFEERPERMQTACGSADPNYRPWFLSFRDFDWLAIGFGHRSCERIGTIRD